MGASQVLQSNSELAASRCRRSRYLERENWKTGFACNMFGIARLPSFLQVRIPQRRVQSNSITGYWGSRFLERNCVSWNLNQEIQIQFTFYYFWLILQLSSECGWCCFLFSEKKSWEVRISQRYDHRFLGHIQNRKKRTSLHLWLNPKQGAAPRRWIFFSVDFCESGYLAGDKVEDGEFALSDLPVNHSRSEDKGGEPEGGAEGHEGDNECLGELDGVHAVDGWKMWFAARLESDFVAAAATGRQSYRQLLGSRSGASFLPVSGQYSDRILDFKQRIYNNDHTGF